MYKISVFILTVAVLCNAVPLRIEDEQLSAETGLRFRRVTCDILSINILGNSLGHAACATHCLAMLKGFRGGRCIDGVCNCRY